MKLLLADYLILSFHVAEVLPSAFELREKQENRCSSNDTFDLKAQQH